MVGNRSVSDSSTGNSVFPSIAIDSQNNIHLFWDDNTDYNSAGTDYDIFHRKYDSATASWDTLEVVSTESTNDSRISSIAIDSFDNLHVVWQDPTNYDSSGVDTDIFYKMFNQTTQIWATTTVISTESSDSSASPSIAIDYEDNIHIVWTDLTDFESAGIDWDIFYKKYNVSTSLWLSTEVVSTESTEDSLNPALVSDSANNIHVVWEDYTNYRSAPGSSSIFYKNLDRDTLEWIETDVITMESTGLVNEPLIIIDSKDNLYVVWEDFSDILGAGIDRDVILKSYNITTKLWSTPELISTESENASFDPAIAIDSTDKTHVLWHDSSNYGSVGTDWDIFYRNKEESQSSWNELFVLSPMSEASELPDLAIDNSQQIHAVWNDFTDYNNAGLGRDIFYTKFSGTPQAPFIEYEGPEQNDGVIYLKWDEVYAAASYSIYRDVKPILSTEGLTKIAETTDSYYVDELETGGTFYYAITANSVNGNSELSNTVFVQVVLNGVADGANSGVSTITITEDSTDEGFLDSPITLRFIFVSITIVVLIKIRKEI